MKDVIIEEILSLKEGTVFRMSDFFDKYNIDKSDRLAISLNIIKELDGKIGSLNDNQIIGLPYNSSFIRK